MDVKQGPGNGTAGVKVFVSYNRDDSKWLHELKLHLRPLVRSKLVDAFYGEDIEWGVPWQKKIDEGLAKAKVAVLLVSKSFLASDYITQVEVPALLAAAERGELILLMIYVSPCDWPKSLSQYQAANPPSQPLAGMTSVEQDRLFSRVVKRIATLVEQPAGDGAAS